MPRSFNVNGRNYSADLVGVGQAWMNTGPLGHLTRMWNQQDKQSRPGAMNPGKGEADAMVQGQRQHQQYMDQLNGALQQQMNSQPLQQDLRAAQNYGRQAAQGRGLSGGMAAGLERRGQQDVHTAFARDRDSNIRSLLGMGMQGNFQNMQMNQQQRQFMMGLAQAAAQGNAQAGQQLQAMLGGVLGGVGGAMVGGPAGAAMGYQLGRGLGGATYQAPQTTLGMYY